MGCLIKFLLGIGTVILLAVLLVFGVQWAVDSYAPSMAAKEIESSTGFRLGVDDLDLSLGDTAVRTQGLTLKNPEGWPEEGFIQVDDFYLNVNPKTVMGDGELIINDLVIDVGLLQSVTNAEGENNARVFIDRLRANRPKEEQPEEKGEARPYLIKHLVLKADSLRVVDYTKSGEPKVREVALDVNSEMTDVTNLTQAIRPILTSLARAHAADIGYALTESIGAADPLGIINGPLNKQLDQLKDADEVTGKARDLLDSLKNKLPQKSGE